MSGLVKRKFFDRFTTTGSNLTWTKPSGITIVWIECIGAGGGGGGGQENNAQGAGGGAGGAMAWGVFPAESLPATLRVNVGTAGAKGLWGASVATAGGIGGTSKVTYIDETTSYTVSGSPSTADRIILQAFGGGGGGGATASVAGGAGGGGTGSAGTSGGPGSYGSGETLLFKVQLKAIV